VNELKCKLCGSKNVNFLFSEERSGVAYNSYHCEDCDLYQTLGDISDVSPDYVDLEEGDLVGEHVFIQRKSKIGAFTQWLEEAKRLDPGLAAGERRSVLDIGCGVGGFLDFARERGFDVYGFDASEAQARVAQKKHPNVRHAISMDDYMAEFAEKPRIDFVTMWDVFEHIRDPKTLLRQVRQYLTPNTVYFVSVPSGKPTKAKLAFAKIRNREIGLIPWEHVFYYTPSSLARVFADNGYEALKVTGVAPYVRDMNMHEFVRRNVHNLLQRTPYAFQICAFAKPQKV